MSRVFRRPMFRGGSTNMNGIMSGIKDRENYAEGTASERYKKIFDQYSKPAMDPLSKLLIQGGLRGLSETRGGGTLANMALAFEKPTEQLMSDLQQRKNAEREMALAGLGMDIKDERSREARMQAVEDIKNKQDFERKQLERKLQGQENIQKIKSDKEFRTEQVRPAFENVVTKRAEAFMQSKNPAVKQNPTLTARNYIRFTREASPEIQSKFKGFKPYTRDNKGNIVEVPYEGQPGQIIYDPISQEFLVFDNTGETYNLNPLTFEIEEK